MSLGKRLFIGEAAAAAACTTESADVFGDGNGIALYSLDYDASDASGNYNATPANLEFGVDGQINWGARFNGTDSELNLGTIVGTGGTARISYSISMWVKTTNTASNKIIVTDFQAGVSTYSLILYGNLTGTLSAYNGFSLGSSVLESTATFNDGNWRHIVVVNDATNHKQLVYLDKVKVIDHTLRQGTKSATAGMKVGYYDNSGGTATSVFDGDIDQIRVFDRALTSNDIDTLYAETACVHTATTDNTAYQAFNVGYWKLDGNGDDEKNTYDAAENNITYEFGRYGTAASFNGTDSYLQVSHDNSFNWTSFNTLSLWVNFDTINSGNTVGIAAKGANTSTFGWYLYKLNSDDKIKFASYNTSDAASVLDTGVVPVAGNWYHICVTGDASTNKIYINGVEKDSASAVTATSTSDNLIFGRFYSNVASNHLEGKIDQIRWFNTALDSTKVANLYNEKQAYITKNASNPFGDNNEVAFYKMENNANDSTGSNNGAANNITFTSGSGLFGTYAASFDGSISNIQIDTLPSITNYNFTCSFWMKTTDTVGYAISFRDPIYITIGTGLFTNTTNGMGIYDGTNGYSITNAAMQTIDDGDWHHIVMTHDGTSLKGYIDGNIIGTVSTGTTTQFSGGTNNNRIGFRGDGNSSGAFSGLIDQVRIFNRALDGDEVFKLYAELIN